MNCPRCTAHVVSGVVEVVDTPLGLLAVTDAPVPTRRAWCACGWEYRITSSIAGAIELTLMEGAA